MIKFVAVAVASWLAATGVALADCTDAATDHERAQCIGQELRASDKVINDTYGQLRDALDDSGRAALRHEEIAWIKARAATCQIDLQESDREKWFASLLTDFNKTVCVVRFTDRRVAELSAQYAALKPKQPAQTAQALPPIPPAAAPGSSSEPDVYDVVGQSMPSTGKWYFEVALKPRDIAKDSSATIFIGAQGIGFSSVGTLQTIRKRDMFSGQRNVGIALDLDQGKLYPRINGLWKAMPGSAAGLDLKLGRPYIVKVSSSVSLTQYLNQGAVDVNFGQHPFVYAIPDGYVALDARGPRRIPEPG